MEKDLKGKGFIKEKKERQGPKGKIAFLLPLPRDQNRGGGRGRRRRPAPASQGAAAAGRRGERERGSRGFDSPSSLGWGGVWRAGHEDR